MQLRGENIEATSEVVTRSVLKSLRAARNQCYGQEREAFLQKVCLTRGV
jgi:hypothetical protein